MRNSLVRGFVVVLALTGFAASTVAARPAASHKEVKAGTTSVKPLPLCLPNDPNFCGLD